MPANWSLILNVLLLIGVIAAIGCLMRARKQSLSSERYQPSVGKAQNNFYNAQQPLQDDIIAVRKVSREPSMHDDSEDNTVEPLSTKSKPQLILEEDLVVDKNKRNAPREASAPALLMMFLLAKDNRQFAGYELLQTVLAAGLRFGEGQLFHRHQLPNGQGPVLCSLAAATATGVFDLQNIGAFSVRGLCLFMHSTQDPEVDAQRFAVLLETAKQLSEGMDAHLLDDQRKPLNAARIARYCTMLHIEQPEYA